MTSKLVYVTATLLVEDEAYDAGDGTGLTRYAHDWYMDNMAGAGLTNVTISAAPTA